MRILFSTLALSLLAGSLPSAQAAQTPIEKLEAALYSRKSVTQSDHGPCDVELSQQGRIDRIDLYKPGTHSSLGFVSFDADHNVPLVVPAAGGKTWFAVQVSGMIRKQNHEGSVNGFPLPVVQQFADQFDPTGTASSLAKTFTDDPPRPIIGGRPLYSRFSMILATKNW